MARKKIESKGPGTPWLNTFADLMNLLLCFFVLLFAYSDVDTEKFEQISMSMANSIGIFTNGGAAIGEGSLISSGMSQLNDLGKLFESMGKTSEGDSDPNGAENNGKDDTLGADEILDGKQGVIGEKDVEGEGEYSDGQSSQNLNENQGKIGIDEAMERIQEERKNVAYTMYDQVSDLNNQYNLGDYTELSMDSNYQYVQLTLSGSVLFDSGSADLKSAAKPILSKLGELLKKFDGCIVEIVGHTDNVPMKSKEFKDNNWLSSARALNAAEYLINKCGLSPATLKYSGRGEYEPIASNATAEGRAKNRRIEIRIYNQYSGG